MNATILTTAHKADPARLDLQVSVTYREMLAIAV